MSNRWRFLNADTSMINVCLFELTDEELRDIKKQVMDEIHRRHVIKMAPKKRKCKDCEYCRYLNESEVDEYGKQYSGNRRGPFCFCGHPKGKLIPWGHTTPSWCKKGKDL